MKTAAYEARCSGALLCLDAGRAGRRAAPRGAGRALPMLTVERTLRVAELPTGEDAGLAAPPPWRRRAARRKRWRAPAFGTPYDRLAPAPGTGATPELRAFRARLVAASALIADRARASEYRRALLDRFFAGTRRPATGAAPVRVRPVQPALSDPAARAVQRSTLLSSRSTTPTCSTTSRRPGAVSHSAGGSQNCGRRYSIFLDRSARKGRRIT